MTPREANLTATVITDRNGKVTTVHKKDQTTPALYRPIPSPVLRGGNQAASLERTLALAERRSGRYGSRNLEGIEQLHSLLADQETGEASIAEQALISLLDDRQTEVMIEAAQTKEGFLPALRLMHGRLSTGQIAGFAALYEKDMFVPPSQESDPETKKASTNMELWAASYEHLKRHSPLGEEYETYTDLSRLDTSGRARAKSFFRLCGVMNEIGHTKKFPQSLVDFTLDGDYDIKEVVSAMRSTKSIDPIVLRGVIEGIEAPVAEGWL
jgi:hypothetical protein